MTNKSTEDIDKCVKQRLEDENVTIGNTYSDAGGKKAAAERDCKYDKATKPKEFKEKFGNNN